MICEKCGKEFNEDWRKDKQARKTVCRFCSKNCANKRSFTKEQNKSKGRKGHPPTNDALKKYNIKMGRRARASIFIKEHCIACGKDIKASKSGYCSKCIRKTKEYIEKISKITKERAASPEEKQRLRDIGRKGGFGKKGFTKNGTRFESSFEEKCFSFLEENKINFEPHKYIPNSTKVSDIYLIDKNKWIELDGINREKRKKWLGKSYFYWLDKLEIYKKEKLDFSVFYTFEEFVKYFK